MRDRGLTSMQAKAAISPFADHHARVVAPLLLVASLAQGCAAAAPEPPGLLPAAPPAPAPVTAPLPPPIVPPEVEVVELDDVIFPFDAYRLRFERSLESHKPGRVAARYDARAQGPLGHEVVTYQSDGATEYLVTVGFGRRSQRHRFGSSPPFVELSGMTDHRLPHVPEILSSLGRYLHAVERPMAMRFQAFDVVRLDQPIHGRQFFVLVPDPLPGIEVGGGAPHVANNAVELPLAPELSVTLLRVVPLIESEYIRLRMRGDGAVRAWWSDHALDPELLRRW